MSVTGNLVVILLLRSRFVILPVDPHPTSRSLTELCVSAIISRYKTLIRLLHRVIPSIGPLEKMIRTTWKVPKPYEVPNFSIT
ncbi:hypothetical protein M758_UG179900 [Ceratodon purpureus]|nr:hypothetical protein M758_UG179900 [Ceratodon purpureus]